MASSSTDYPRIVAEGLQALQTRQYDQAVALLKPVMGDRQGPGNVRLKAALGLFQAYGESGQTAAAQELGQQLKSHKNPQVRDRAIAIWNRLYGEGNSLDKEPDNSAASGSGFTPFEGGTSSGANLPEPNPDFQPISPNSPRKVVRQQVRQKVQPSAPAAPSAAKSLNVNGVAAKSLPTNGTNGKGGSANPAAIASPPPAFPPRKRVVINANAANGAPASTAPVNDLQTSTAPGGPQPYEPQWRNGEKIERWGTLPGAPKWGYQGLQLLSAIAFGAFATTPFVLLSWLYNQIIFRVTWLPTEDLELIPLRPGSFIGIWLIFAVLLGTTPWLIDEGLKRLCQGRTLRLLDLNSQRPDTGRLLQRQCRRHKIAIPQLVLLPTMDPVLFSYGSRQANARIVVSQGVLEAVDEGELSALFGAELGHIIAGDMRVMGWGTLMLALPFGSYWGSAKMIDRWQMPIPRAMAIAVSAISYEIFRLGRWPLLWLSRSRIGYGDRQSVLSTGDPNGLSRALVKLAIATTERLHQENAISPLLELTQLVLPVPPVQSIPVGSLYPHSPLEPYLQWERRNPYRHWLRSNSTHPTLGDRLFRHSQWAERWKLEPEWDLSRDHADQQTLKYLPRVGTACLPPTPFTLWHQSAPAIGAIVGAAIGVLLWMPGGIGEILNLRGLDWMYGDRSLLIGFALLGFGTGTIIRVNSFFPDIKTLGLVTSATPDRPLAAELNDPNALPVNSRVVRLQGRLLGRQPRENLLGQHWWLQTDTGTVRLRLGNRFGHLGKLWNHWTRPIKPNGSVEVIGWLRRGATPWLDVDILNHKNAPNHVLIKKSWTKIDGHPLWSTGLAIGAIALGLWILNRGL
ncbi:MAG: M48 family metalloprotease [Cyanophyceae cyanobacterium]